MAGHIDSVGRAMGRDGAGLDGDCLVAQQKTPGFGTAVDQAPHRDALGHSMGDVIGLWLCEPWLNMVGACGIRICRWRNDAFADRLAQPHGRTVDLAASFPLDVAQRSP